ncbi:hypothetical protein [Hymenobacter terrenus]|uniref:hypothetical protein n=1 Tax=Hymenobacter terrenus TaxID=1629124 RepID=UPI0012E02DBA|nr:hypothetical protein [Hymenobacter terrenus]
MAFSSVSFVPIASRLVPGLALLALPLLAPAQTTPPAEAPPAPLSKRGLTVLSGFAVGPSLPGSGLQHQAKTGFDATTTFELSLNRPDFFRFLWLRITLDALQLQLEQQVKGPNDYRYDVSLNGTVASVFADIGFRREIGRFAPGIFVGTGGSYVSSTQVKSEQNGQLLNLGRPSFMTYAVRSGVTLEYLPPKRRLIPYVELTWVSLPDAVISGQQLQFFTPLLGMKLPL